MEELSISRRHALSEMDRFELRLEQGQGVVERGIDMALFQDTGGSAAIPPCVFVKEEALQEGLLTSQLLMRQQHEDMITRRTANQRRRGRLIREYEARDALQATLASDKDIISQLMFYSSAEIEEREKIGHLQKQKQVIVQNYHNHLTKLAQFEDEMLARTEASRKFSAHIEWMEDVELAKESHRAKMLAGRHALESASHMAVVEEVDGILNRVLDIVLWTASYREVGNYADGDHDAPDFLTTAAKVFFASRLHAIFALPFPGAMVLRDPNSMERFILQSELLSSLALNVLSSSDSLPENKYSQRDNICAISEQRTQEYVEVIATAESIETGSDFVTNRDDPSLFLPSLTSSMEDGAQISPPTVQLQVPSESFLSLPFKHVLAEIITDVRNTAPGKMSPPPPRLSIVDEHFRAIVLGSSLLARRILAEHLCVNRKGVRIVSLRDIIAEAVTQQNPTVLQYLRMGSAIPDSICVGLLVNELVTLQNIDGFCGYVLVDFPNSINEAVLLLQALSGINFGELMPHRSDLAPRFVSHLPFAKEFHSASSSGLSDVFLAESSADQIFSDDGVSRFNLQTSKVLFLDEDTATVDYLVPRKTEGLNKYTIGLETIRREDALTPLLKLLEDVGLLTRVKVTEQGGVDLSFVDKVYGGEAGTLMTLGICGEKKPEEKPTETMLNSETESESSFRASLPLISPSKRSSSSQLCNELIQQNSEISVAPSSFSVKFQCSLSAVSQRLAVILSRLWDQVEKHSLQLSSSLFHSLEEVRFLTILRRRSAQNSLQMLLSRNDEKQILVNTFCETYNSLEVDFHFDDECKAELCLRAIELRDSFLKIAKVRKLEAEDAMMKVMTDNMVALSTHRLYCEGAAVLQGAINRFTVGLHAILDYTRSILGRVASSKIESDLEETLRGLFDVEKEVKGKDGKSKSKEKSVAKKKKGEPADPVPYREAVGKLVLTLRSVELPPEDKPVVITTKVLHIASVMLSV